MNWDVQLVGPSHWAAVLGELLRAAGIPSRYDERPQQFGFGIPARLRLARWAWGPALRDVNFVHHIWVSRSMSLVRAIHLRRIPQLLHWIGTDLVSVRGLPAWRRSIWLRTARRLIPLHLADSPELAEEVAALGLPRPRVIRLLPLSLRPQPSPLPSQFAVLSYWSTDSMGLYRAGWVLQLARDFPHVPFNIVGRCTVVPDAPPNVQFVGWAQDMAPWYERATVLVRLLAHDSVSVMVLEMLARGRHAIYSRPLPHCRHAETYEQARDALAELLAHPAPNAAGPEFVAREFNPQEAVAGLQSVYADLARMLGR